MRHVGGECDATHAFGRDRLLLVVNGFTRTVVTGHVDGARRSGGPDFVAGDITIAGQHEHIVAQRLPVVGRVVLGNDALIVKLGHFGVCFLRQVATVTRWVPRTVAGDARHILIGMRAIFRAIGTLGKFAPDHLSIFHADCFGKRALGVIMLAFHIDSIFGLHHFPDKVTFNHAALINASAPAFEARFS